MTPKHLQSWLLRSQARFSDTPGRLRIGSGKSWFDLNKPQSVCHQHLYSEAKDTGVPPLAAQSLK